ncbi:hypothetical protein VP01_2202g1 [Puccinia sorghi]|uniref:Uncharacterized protein n=1 Tax=Puccinia sorghi TaxID=27349 RepID=A0A0L6V9K2_9BASI|nr:hypothetical protein VP01_2202g1 [Puccinia sorghi]
MSKTALYLEPQKCDLKNAKLSSRLLCCAIVAREMKLQKLLVLSYNLKANSMLPRVVIGGRGAQSNQFEIVTMRLLYSRHFMRPAFFLVHIGYKILLRFCHCALVISQCLLNFTVNTQSQRSQVIFNINRFGAKHQIQEERKLITNHYVHCHLVFVLLYYLLWWYCSVWPWLSQIPTRQIMEEFPTCEDPPPTHTHPLIYMNDKILPFSTPTSTHPNQGTDNMPPQTHKSINITDHSQSFSVLHTSQSAPADISNAAPSSQIQSNEPTTSSQRQHSHNKGSHDFRLGSHPYLIQGNQFIIGYTQPSRFFWKFKGNFQHCKKELAQLPAVDMQNAPAKLPCKLCMFAYVDVLAQSLCRLHSDCASKLG